MPLRFRSIQANRWLLIGLALVVLMATLSLVGPAYRLKFLFEINLNEAWYAYHAKAIIEGRPLYPSLDQLTTNNYPPLSFYVMALISILTDQPIIAGRVLSFFWLIGIAIEIFFILRILNTTVVCAAIAAITYLATMARLFDNFVGTNDFQLLAQLLMTLGFIAFLRERQSGARWFAGSVSLMALAGFFKHNIVAMPLASFLILITEDKSRAIRFLALGIVLISIGLFTCAACFGSNFASNVFAIRPYSITRGLKALEDLHKVPVQFIAWTVYAATTADNGRARVVSILCGSALAESVITRGAEEVHYNAGFDFIIVVHIALGRALQRTMNVQYRSKQITYIPALIILGIVSRLGFGGANDSFHVLTSASFRARLALAAETTADEVIRVQRLSDQVFCESVLICYLARKAFIVDPTNVRLRMAAGELPPDALIGRLSSGDLIYVPINLDALVGNR
jgi:hypothetical protein